MNICVLDFETFFSTDITLKKMNYSEYVPAAQPISVAFIHRGIIDCVQGPDIADKLAQIDWPNTILVGHNLLFDALVLKHWYGHQAKYYIDTLCEARHLYPTSPHDLGSLAERFCPQMPKIKENLQTMKGKTWEELTEDEQLNLIQYNKTDVLITAKLYEIWKLEVSQFELDLIDHTIKIFINPTLILDIDKATAAIDEERQETLSQLNKFQLTKETIRSDAKFVAHLESLGYKPPCKWSNKKQVHIPALAKGDAAFQEFYNQNPEIQELLDLKRKINSNIKESRTTRLITAANNNNGKIPVAYNYHGAFTGRYCLTGDTIISVLRNQEVLDIILPGLLPDDLVWDGDEFVTHGGLIDQGIHEVISYDGLTGTPDHRVFIDEISAPIELRTAMERNYPIKVAKPAPRFTTNTANPNRGG